MMDWYHGDWGYSGIAGMAMMVALWGVIIGFAVWAIAHFTRTEPSQVANVESSHAILDRRLASGEIGAEEYARIRHALNAPDAPGLTSSSP